MRLVVHQGGWAFGLFTSKLLFCAHISHFIDLRESLPSRDSTLLYSNPFRQSSCHLCVSYALPMSQVVNLILWHKLANRCPFSGCKFSSFVHCTEFHRKLPTQSCRMILHMRALNPASLRRENIPDTSSSIVFTTYWNTQFTIDEIQMDQPNNELIDESQRRLAGDGLTSLAV